MGIVREEFKEKMVEEFYTIRNHTVVPNRGPHFHEEFELTIICSDEPDLQYMVNGRIEPLKKNSLVFFSNMDVHMLQKTAPAAIERCSVHFRPEMVMPFCTSNTNLLSLFFMRLNDANLSSVLQLTESESVEYLELFRKLEFCRNQCHRSDYGVDVQSITLLIQMLLMLNRLFNEKYGFAGMPPTTLNQEKYRLVSDMIQFIQAHFADELHLDRLCEHFYVSKSQVNSLFRGITGLTPSQYIAGFRLRKAKEYLLQNLPVETVCIQSGFHDLSHFSHVFKQREGISPKKYQMLYRHLPSV